MKLYKYILENNLINNDMLNKRLMKKYNITQKDINKAQKELMKKHKVEKKFLPFGFVWEVLEGKVFLTFHIEDPNHKNYQSSVNYTFL